MSLIGMIRALNGAEIQYVVVGGVAGTVHGSTHVTNDLDICYDSGHENRRALAGLLESWDAYPRGVEPDLPFIMDDQTLGNAEMLTLTTSQGPIDIFQRVAGVGDYRECVRMSERIDASGIKFSALGLDALIAAKHAAGRAKDIEHVRELEALREKRREREQRDRD